jgi:hypothetical protein
MVNVRAGPIHVPIDGVTVMVAVWVVVGEAAVALILPVPVAGIPIAGLLLVQEYVAPAPAPLKAAAILPPPQIEISGTVFIDGPGDTVILNVIAGPEQAESIDCTVIIPV